MTSTRRGASTAALGLLGVVVLAVAALAAFTWVRESGPATRVRSDEGGVSVRVPSGWAVEQNHPKDPQHQEFLRGHENAAFGFLQRGGFWVARWSTSQTTTLATLRADHEKTQARRHRAAWSVREEFVAGFAGLVLRYSEPPGLLERLRLGDRRVVVREFVRNGFVYQVGTWELPHAGRVTRQLVALANSVEVFAPRGWKADVAHDARVALPGGWVERDAPADIDDVVFFALGPGDPTTAWVYVFYYPTESVRARVAKAHKTIPNNGGTITQQSRTTLDGRAAERLDFFFGQSPHPRPQNSEWFVRDGHGGSYVLAVGRRSGDPDVAERVRRAWQWR